MNRWLVALACCFINFAVLGVARLVPVLFVASMERYQTDRAKASLPYVLCYILRTISGPILGLAGKKFGYGPMTFFGVTLSAIGVGICFFAEDILAVTILWGCLYGFGFGFATSLLPAVIDKHFDSSSKTTANGIAIAGSSLGGILLPPLFKIIIKEYGLSGSFLIMCGLLLQALPASMLIYIANSQLTRSNKPPNVKCLDEGQDKTAASQMESLLTTTDRTDPATTPSARKVSTLKTLALFLDPTFILIMIAQSSYGFFCLLVWTILLDFVRDTGMDRTYEVYPVILLPLSDLVGRLGLGWIKDGGYLTTTKFCVVISILLGLVTFLFLWVKSLMMICLVISLFGLISGGLIIIFPVAVCEFIVPQYKIMGLTSRMILMAPLTALASPLIGYFRDQKGSYDGIFLVCGGTSLACAVLHAMIPGFSKRSREKFEQNK